MNYSHFVGLDVGKKTFDASLMSADEKELSHKSFDNTPTGIQSLLDSWLSSLFIQTLVLCWKHGKLCHRVICFQCLHGIFPGFGLPVDHQEVHRLATRQKWPHWRQKNSELCGITLSKTGVIQIAWQRLGETAGMDYYTWQFGQAKSIKHKVIGNILLDG